MDSRERFDNMKTIWILIGVGVTLFWVGIALLVIHLPGWALIASSAAIMVGVAWFGSWLDRQS